MDPVAVLSAVAASLQLIDVAAKVTLRSFSLIRGLRETPREMCQLLDDTERSTARILSISSALKPGSQLFGQLSAVQNSKLSGPLRKLLLAMEGLNRLLQPLCNQKEVSECLEKVRRLNEELLQALEAVGLEMQAVTHETSSELLHIIKQSKRDLVSRLDEMNQVNRDRERATESNHLETATLMESLRLQGERTTQDVSQVSSMTMKTLALVRRTNQSLASAVDGQKLESLHHAIQALPDLMVRQLQEGLSAALIQQKIAFQADSFASRPNRKQAIRHSVSLIVPCGKSHQASELYTCNCRRATFHSSSSIWRVSLIKMSSAEHHPDCSWHKAAARSWSYSLAVKLSPFINRTMQITWGSTFSFGQRFMPWPLRFHRIVQRSESPLFQLFDEFPEKTLAPTSLSLIRNPRARIDRIDKLTWNVTEVTNQLAMIETFMKNMLRNGEWHGTDVDENGFSLLVEIVHLSILCSDEMAIFESQFKSLLNLALEAGCDIWQQMSVEQHRKISKRTRLWQFSCDPEDPRNAVDWTFSVLEMPNERIYSLFQQTELLDTFGNIQFDYASVFQRLLWLYEPFRMKYLLRHPDLAEQLGFTNLEIHILKRQFSDVQKLVVLGHPPCVSDPMRLAVSWEEGLKSLITSGYDTTLAIMTACELKELESCRILFSSTSMLFDFGYYDAEHHHSRANYLEVFSLLTYELFDRLNDLKVLALQHLSQQEADIMEISKLGPLDCSINLVWESLGSKIVLPKFLDFRNLTSAYDIPWDGVTTEHLNKIYEAGFSRVDIPDMKGRTPLLVFLERPGAVEGHNTTFAEVSYWFVARGAELVIDVSYEDGTCQINILKIFVVRMVMYGSLLEPCSEWSLPETRVREHFREVYDIRDKCKCSCSGTGCPPVAFLWRPGKIIIEELGSRGNLHHDEPLQWFIELCALSDSQIRTVSEDLCLLELFNRLGMTHTCCGKYATIDPYDYSLPSTCISCTNILTEDLLNEEERKEIQQEELELNAQLLLLHNEYRELLSLYKGPLVDFSYAWWDKIDKILPPLRYMDPYGRGNQERETLERNGYDPEQPFIDIIRQHFGTRPATGDVLAWLSGEEDVQGSNMCHETDSESEEWVTDDESEVERFD